MIKTTTETAIEIAFTQHSGKQQRSQQDALWNGQACVQARNAPTNSTVMAADGLLLAVADGVAISPVPHLASRFVVETLAQLVAASATAPALSTRTVRAVHGKLCDRYAHGDTQDTSTTLVAAQFQQGSCLIANVGDSRAYRITAAGAWTQLSRDHTVLNDLRDEGFALEEDESGELCDGLSHCLVANDEEDGFSVHLSQCAWLAGDSLLLCSDGLHDTLADAEIQRLFSPHNTPLQQVEVWREAVLAAGAPDNFSMVLARRLPNLAH